MDAFILRSKPHNRDREEDFLKGKISIGWPCFKNLEGNSREDIANILADVYDSITEVQISMVYLFVKMPVGSIVLTPSVKDKTFIHIFRTTGIYQYDSSRDNNEIGNPHLIDVEHVKTVVRKSLPAPVLSSLSGARKTLSRISKHCEILENYIELEFKTDKEVHSDSDDIRIDAINVLSELLNSEEDNIRLQAAIAMLNATQ